MSRPQPDEFVATCDDCAWRRRAKDEDVIEQLAGAHARINPEHTITLEARGTIYLGILDASLTDNGVDWQEA